MSSPSQTHARGGAARQLRIIGGAWRGRRLRFPPSPAIRPTPDRVRETLFNWLTGVIVGARCLDLFAGSGALGLEAISRGALHVTFLEHDPRAVHSIEDCLRQWDPAGRCSRRVVRADAREFLAGVAEPFDIVFLDPPFASGLLGPMMARLEAGGWLRPEARIYVECAAADTPSVPPQWNCMRSNRSGQVGYHLYLRQRGIAVE